MVEEIQSKSILNPTGGFLSTYTHSLNAYQGCAFGREPVPVLLCARDACPEIRGPSLGRMGEGEDQRARIAEARIGGREAQRDVRKSADFHEHGDRSISGG